MSEWWQLVIAISGSIVTGIVSLVGVYLTLRHNEKLEQKRFAQLQKDKQQEIIENRPEFEICSWNFDTTEKGYEPDDFIDIDCMLTLYGEKYKKTDFENKLVCANYTIKNISNNVVEFVDLCFYHDQYQLLNMKKADLDRFVTDPNGYLTSTHIRYSGMKVKHNQEINVRIWYRVNNVPQRIISYLCFIGCRSFDKRYWVQNFEAPFDGIEDSCLKKESEYYSFINRTRQ